MSVPSRCSLAFLLVLLPAFAGCAAFKKKPADTQTITTQVEESFKQRWVERRTAELSGQGVAQDEARRRALVEFRDKYEFTGAAHE
ncbi:MAG: hypothetical protein ACO3DQ_04130 [Cephaloticoccus sp.]